MFTKEDFKLAEVVASLETNSVEIFSTLMHDALIQVLKVYKPDPNGVKLIEQIDFDWQLFPNSESAEKVLKGILSENDFDDAGLTLDSTVSYSDDIESVKKTWEDLKKTIKTRTRFNIDISSLSDLGWDGYLNEAKETVSSDTEIKFYRARLHSRLGESFSIEQMGPPTPDRSKAGRANPDGIVYLYLSDRQDTTLYEVRATYLDQATIGQFFVKEGEKVTYMDFTKDAPEASFFDSDLTEVMKVRTLIDAISKDLSKPMRRFDSTVEYVPTQFICEYIRDTYQVDGIRFNTSVGKDGSNFVIFNPDLFECRNVEDFEVNDLTLHSENI